MLCLCQSLGTLHNHGKAVANQNALDAAFVDHGREREVIRGHHTDSVIVIFHRRELRHGDSALWIAGLTRHGVIAVGKRGSYSFPFIVASKAAADNRPISPLVDFDPDMIN